MNKGFIIFLSFFCLVTCTPKELGLEDYLSYYTSRHSGMLFTKNTSIGEIAILYKHDDYLLAQAVSLGFEQSSNDQVHSIDIRIPIDLKLNCQEVTNRFSFLVNELPKELLLCHKEASGNLTPYQTFILMFQRHSLDEQGQYELNLMLSESEKITFKINQRDREFLPALKMYHTL